MAELADITWPGELPPACLVSGERFCYVRIHVKEMG